MYSCVRFLIEMVHCAGRTRGVIYTVDAGPSSAATDADSRGRLNFFPPLTKHRTHGQSCETTAPLLVNTAQRGATADIYSDGARRNIIKMVSRETSMLFASPLTPLSPLRQVIADAYTADETDCVESLLRGLALDTDARVRIARRAREHVIAVRGHQRRQGTLEAFLQEYDLSSQEGVVLMCLAEALLRIPDAATVDRLIRDRLGKGDWDEHLGHSHSLWVNASTWGLMLTGRVVRLAPDLQRATRGTFARLIARLGEPVIRLALKQAMRILGEQFVMGRTIEEALARSTEAMHREYRHSFDMLGEAALTERDAERYTAAYLQAICTIAARDAIFPQFATHNAHSVAAIREVAGRRRDFEFQRLHGMGEALYHEVLHRADTQLPCRVYAPVGSHEDLLPYLVRRLLENGANTSFVHRLEDERTPIDVLVADPVAEIDARVLKPHPRIPLPRYIYPDRRNSAGLNLTDRATLETLDAEMETVAATVWHAAPCVAGHIMHGDARPVYDPSDRRREIGTVLAAAAVTVERAVASASEAAAEWVRRGANERAAILERAADLFEEHRAELKTLCVREGGKTVVDALAELREAVDFCRYYASAARRDFATPHVLPCPTGELNELQRHGRCVFACISPWNFPLAIFTGQIAAAVTLQF